MMLSLIPVTNAALSNNLSVSTGPVGIKVTVSGTLNTFNGRYSIRFDADDDTLFGTPDGDPAAEDLAGIATTERATGYAFSKEVTLPDAYGGARKIRVQDLDAAGAPVVDAFFTVTTTYALEIDNAINYEGGGIGAPNVPSVFTMEIHGAPIAWALGIDYQIRIKNPSAALAATSATFSIVEGAPGYYTDPSYTIGPNDVAFVSHGTYTAYLDYDETASATWKTNKATTTFEIRVSDQAIYERTQDISVNILPPAGKTIDKVDLVGPDGSVVATTGAGLGVVNPAFTTATLLYTLVKDDALGTYVVKALDAAGAVLKSQSIAVAKANIVVAIATPATDFTEGSAITGAGVAIAAANQGVQRMHTVEAIYTLTYPDGTPASSADLPAGLDVKVALNGTVLDTKHLDPLTSFTAPNLWTATWKIPKDAAKGENYEFNVTAASMTDAYGNTGPKNTFSTRSVNFFKVATGTLYVTSMPTLSFPGALANLPVTSTAKALTEVKYADNSRFTGTDMQWFNVTLDDTLGNVYAIVASASDYNGDVGLWLIKEKIPYDAVLGAGYGFAYDGAGLTVEDKWGNVGPDFGLGNPAQIVNVASATFAIIKATINISELAVNAASYESDDQLTATFKATYAPSGDIVSTRDVAPFPIVSFYDSNDALVATVRAGYSSGTQKWTASWIIPAGTLSGTYNATINALDFKDDTAVNDGPTAKKYTNFDVSRVSLTDVLAASDAAKASADLASTKADAAKTAADTAATKADAAAAAATSAGTAATAAGAAANAAKTAADGAKTSADAAGVKADAATAAANGAKTAADSAAAAANNLTTLVYGAIGASLVAALAAIVALMQISRKIA